MLAIRDLHLSIQGRKLLDGAEATVPAGHRVGVVGRNGSGKTTLFRAIRGELPVDGGSIDLPKNWRLGGVAQEAPASQDCLIDIVLAADAERDALLREAETAQEPDRIAEIQTRLADIEAHSAEARAASILRGLGFDAAAQARAAAEFSGGWRMRVALAGALFAAPDLLLLDEPTNYLDLEGAVWLETFLARYPRTVLLISHDRGLLNRSVGAILHLSEQKLALYNTPYDRFAAQRRERLAQIGAQTKRQESERARIQSFVDRFRAKATKARQAQARLKMLEKMEPIATVVEEGVAAFHFPEPEPLSPPILTLEEASVGYDGAPVLSGLSLRIDQDDRIALLGANGQGKSTLSKLLANLLKPLEGERVCSSKLRIGYFAQHQLDGLTPGEDAIAHIRRLRPQEPPARLRARLGAAGIGADIAEAGALEHDFAHDAQKMRDRQAFADRFRPARHRGERKHETGKQDRRQKNEEGHLHRLHLRTRDRRDEIAEHQVRHDEKRDRKRQREPVAGKRNAKHEKPGGEHDDGLDRPDNDVGRRLADHHFHRPDRRRQQGFDGAALGLAGERDRGDHDQGHGQDDA